MAKIEFTEENVKLGLIIVSSLMGMANQIYKSISMVKGDIELPSYEDLLKANTDLQDEIDKEK